MTIRSKGNDPKTGIALRVADSAESDTARKPSQIVSTSFELIEGQNSSPYIVLSSTD
jgi:hypothetical protein